MTSPPNRARGHRWHLAHPPSSHAKGDRNGSRLHPDRLWRGERHANAKLTEQAVREIRGLYRSHLISQKVLAAAYGVSARAVWQILHFVTWRHVIDEVAP